MILIESLDQINAALFVGCLGGALGIGILKLIEAVYKRLP